LSYIESAPTRSLQELRAAGELEVARQTMNQIQFAHHSATQRPLNFIAKALVGVSRTGPLATLCLAVLTVAGISLNAEAQANEWTWMGGSSTVACNASGCSQPGVYGALGTPASGNIPGGREDAATWTDNSGNLWLFGGTGFDSSSNVGSLNDLWEFNPSTKLWTWVGGSKTVGNNGGQPGVYGTLGVAAAGNIPGGRSGAASWTDRQGNLWLFGGQGFDSGTGTNDAARNVFLNDLWEFNTSTLEWAWMGGGSSTVCPSSTTSYCGQSGVYGTKGTSGAGNIPGGRYSATASTDSYGNFWLFGGYGYGAAGACCYLNDLWEFTPTTGQWTWISGGSGGEQAGVYGTEGTPAAGNTPGSRYFATSWVDSSGHFWLYGGYGFDAGSVGGYLDDLWEFNPPTNDWVWSAGSDAATCWSAEACPATAIYGTLGVPAAADTPGDRSAASSWIDKSGNFWLFGSNTWRLSGTTVTNNNLNDLWELNPSSKEWGWMSGSSAPNKAGVYGTLGTPAAGNAPGGRDFASSWTDDNGNLWLFGGAGLDANGNSGWLNDLWEYQPSTATTTKTTPTLTVTPGSSSITTAQPLSVTVAVSGAPTPTGSVILSSGSYSSTATTLTAGSATITIPAGSLATGSDTLTASYTPDSNSSSTYNSASGANSVTVTVATKTTPTLTVTPGSSSISTAQVLSVTVTVSGTPTPTGSVTLSSGSYSSAATTLTSGSASVTIPAGSLATGSDTLTANYTPDSNSSSTYNSASGTNSVMVTATSGAPGEWTWIGGSNTVDHGGVYGMLGTPAAGNTPGSRQRAVSWTDISGDLWLFGGFGYAANGTGTIGVLNDLWKFNPSTNQWAWMSGSSTVPSTCITGTETCGQTGVYGTLGVPAAGNVPGGRFGAVSWTDNSGHLWLFGGLGHDSNGNYGDLNDLWEFNPSTNQWAWMGGSSTDNQSGVYGTLGTPAAGNVPGGREYAVSWTDGSGNFWLFGGGDFNDLWKFNPSTDQWAWMSGSNTASTSGEPGVYGTLGAPAAGNVPGSRYLASSWTDNSGHLWLFGGEGYDSTDEEGWLNDLWEYNPSMNEWAWMGGSGIVNNFGVYGTLGTPAAANVPGGREGALSWTDSSGHFWLFGGDGEAASNSGGDLNDLWEFNPSTNQWAWMSGSSSTVGTNGGQPGVYGTLGTPAAGNIPGGRFSAVRWTDGSGHLWLFGGYGYDVNGNQDLLNDLWEYQPSAATPTKTTPTVAVTLGSSSITTAQPLSVTVAVSGTPTPTGSVILSSGSYSSAATTLTSGNASITIPAGSLATGSNTLTANYTPDSNSSSTYSSATGTSSPVTVAQVLQTITFTNPGTQTVGMPLSLSATASSGLAVTFTSTTASICTVSSTTATFIAAGTCTVDANQAGNSIYAAATMVQQSFSVNAAPTFTGGGGGGSISIAPGATTANTVTISVTPSNGFNGTVNLTCSISPTAASDPATCSLAPSSVTISGSTVQTSTLTIKTTAATSAANQRMLLFWSRVGGTALALILLIWIPRRRCSWLPMLGLLVLFVSIGAMGCGGGGSSLGGGGGGGGGGNTGTTPGTYTVTVTGTSGSLTVTLGTVTLIVQ